jgi:hypothetical protein
MSDQSEKSDQPARLDEDLVVTGDRPLSIPGELPVLPLRDTVLFPNSFMPLAVAAQFFCTARQFRVRDYGHRPRGCSRESRRGSRVR